MTWDGRVRVNGHDVTDRMPLTAARLRQQYEEQKPMPEEHARFGGSNCHAWINCAMTITACESLPASPTNQAAIEGTAMHDCMDVMLKDATKEPKDFKGATIKTVTITDAHVTQMEVALGAYIEITNEVPETAQIKSEQRVVILDDTWGTADILIWTKDHLKIADFKFGTLEIIDAHMNEQLMFYAIAARKTLKIKPKTIELIVIQPAMDPAMDRFTIDAAMLDAFEESIYAGRRAALAPNPIPVEGEWCKWRACKLICPLKLGRIDSLTMPNHALSLDDIGARLLKIDALSDWADEARKRIQLELEHGRAVKGWKLVAKRAIRQWHDESKTIAFFKKKRFKPEQYLETKLLSPAKAEKLLDKKTVATMADPVSSGNTIAPTNDKRPEVIPAAALGRALNKLI